MFENNPKAHPKYCIHEKKKKLKAMERFLNVFFCLIWTYRRFWQLPFKPAHQGEHFGIHIDFHFFDIPFGRIDAKTSEID